MDKKSCPFLLTNFLLYPPISFTVVKLYISYKFSYDYS